MPKQDRGGEPADLEGDGCWQRGRAAQLHPVQTEHAGQQRLHARPRGLPLQHDPPPPHRHQVQGVPDVRLRVPICGCPRGRHTRPAHLGVQRQRGSVLLDPGGAPESEEAAAKGSDMGLCAPQLPVHSPVQAEAHLVCGHWPCRRMERPPLPHSAGHHPQGNDGPSPAGVHGVPGRLQECDSTGVGQDLVHQQAHHRPCLPTAHCHCHRGPCLPAAHKCPGRARGDDRPAA
mmetsp:Transcript_1284/g.3683  ORF Transcript_1284/g.3683 Transcript_1284/m.3683 type:complete len:231 (-) Transcript_1284:697-1389(-)